MSLVPLLTGEAGDARLMARAVKNASFSQYPRAPRNMDELWAKNKINHDDPSMFKYMGMSVRTVDWRYTAWFAWNNVSFVPVWEGDQGSPPFAELYDHRGDDPTVTDFDADENENLSGRPELAYIEASLLQMIRVQFKDPALAVGVETHGDSPTTPHATPTS